MSMADVWIQTARTRTFCINIRRACNDQCTDVTTAATATPQVIELRNNYVTTDPGLVLEMMVLLPEGICHCQRTAEVLFVKIDVADFLEPFRHLHKFIEICSLIIGFFSILPKISRFDFRKCRFELH